MSYAICAVILMSSGWLNDFDQAKAIAKQESKPILLNFSGSDWCGPCIKMKKQVFETDQFREFADNHLVLLKADFPRLKKNQLDKKQKEHNEKLAELYNPEGKFPLTLLLSQEGKVLKTWDGYTNMSVSQFVDAISEHVQSK